MAKRKKLYYDLLLVDSGSLFSFDPTTFPDRYGNTLDALAALTIGSDGRRKAQNAVTALFQCSFLTVPAAEPPPSTVCVDFTELDLVTPIPGVPGFPGQDAVYRQRFGVRTRPLDFGPSFTLRGVLYIERQHSIEV